MENFSTGPLMVLALGILVASFAGYLAYYAKKYHKLPF